jgi:hypothetical protein
MVHPGTLFHRRQRGIPMHSYENRSEIRALVEVRQRDAVALPPLPQHVFPQVATRHELRAPAGRVGGRVAVRHRVLLEQSHRCAQGGDGLVSAGAADRTALMPSRVVSTSGISLTVDEGPHAQAADHHTCQLMVGQGVRAGLEGAEPRGPRGAKIVS